MIVVVNFSHPLNDQAKEIITERFGAGDAVIHEISVQLDMEQPLQPQLRALADQALALPQVHGNHWNVDCIIPPGHPVAAAYIARRFPGANIVAMNRFGVLNIYLPLDELIRPTWRMTPPPAGPVRSEAGPGDGW